jgi:hypothetical protein
LETFSTSRMTSPEGNDLLNSMADARFFIVALFLGQFFHSDFFDSES